MTNPGMPDWALEIPWADVHQERPNQLVRPFTAQQLIEFGKELIEQFLKRVVLAVAGFFIPGEAAFEQLVAWGERIGKMFENLAALFGITDADLDGDIDVEDVWQAVVTTFIQPLLDLFGAIGDGINAILGPIFGGIDLTDPPTPGEVWQTVINTLMLPLNLLLGPLSPVNAANLFGRIALPQFGSGVPIMSLTTAVPNELEPFTATSVPNQDGWSYNASEDAAQVVCDGSTKSLYLKSGVIKVEEGQPLDTSIDVKYSGVTSGAGQTIRYVLETFTTPDGTGTATPVIVGAINNPSGTITTPVTLGDSSWDIPAGVQSVRPALQTDELITAGTVYWKNTPELYKKLLGVLSGGLGPAIQERINDLNDLINSLLTDPASVIGTLAANMVEGLEDFWDAITAKTVNLTSGGFFDAGKLANITGTISQSLITGLNSSLNALNTFTQNVVDAILSALRGVPIIGGVIADLISDITGLKSTADTALDTSNQIVEDTNAGWTGGTPSGTPTAVYDTITEIRNATSGVYTVEVKTTSGTWTNPGGIVEFWAICIGSGDGGSGGGSGTPSGSVAVGGDQSSITDPIGAAAGKYLAQQINPADLGPTESYTVPAGGAGGVPGSTVGGAGSAATFGSHASSDSVEVAGIAGLVGYYNADNSSPGYAGAGGPKTAANESRPGYPGKSTPLAAGGTAGAAGGGDGGPGGSASMTGQTRCGGGGGGGGGGNASGKGGNGGPGGFPGGGGGGGGGGLAGSGSGNGGAGANGVVVLIYR